MAPAAEEPTRAEVMAVAIARRLRDGETIAVGSVSPIPAGACLLAKRLHAPGARLILLGSRAHFPFNGGVQEFYNYAVRGRLESVGVAPGRIRVEGYADTVPLPESELEGLSPDQRLARHRRVIVRIY